VNCWVYVNSLNLYQIILYNACILIIPNCNGIIIMCVLSSTVEKKIYLGKKTYFDHFVNKIYIIIISYYSGRNQYFQTSFMHARV